MGELPGIEGAVTAAGAWTIGARIDAYWRPSVPAERLAAMRILVGAFALAYLAVRFGHLLRYATFDPAQFKPTGVVRLLDRPLVPWLVRGLVAATLASAFAFVVGWRFRITGPVFAALLLCTLTYRNSWGMIWHTENMLVLEVIVLSLTASADAWSLDARRAARAGRDAPGEHARYGWPLRLMCMVIVIAYVLAGIAKLRNGGSNWLWGDELLNHIAIDNARKALLGDFYSPIAGPLLSIGWMFKFMALATVAFELGAPIAMFGRRAALVWVSVVVAFHWAVVATMMIGFPFQLCGIGFACFFAPERWLRWGASRYRGLRSRARSEAPR